ncbi:hypothetical protein [Microbacterium sp. Marseille-Q6648]|uniref:hypothetical protein n=1 Tax=Microbacterium sp. Marseille-Q6648 TaxID=2937991 RepID=UPI002040B02F|nr:hypothetical protein [Microbacterium sp. Marseille-Q6648]
MNEPHLHAMADAIWRAADPGDTAAARYAAAAEHFLSGVPVVYVRPTKWILTLRAYERFWEQHDRTPRENTRARSTLPAAERHLGEWARYQRRFEEHLNGYQLGRLEVSPAFVWDLRGANWHRHLIACHAHRAESGQLPRLNADDTEEFALARWLGRQLRRLQLGNLTPAQTRQLSLLLAHDPRPR